MVGTIGQFLIELAVVSSLGIRTTGAPLGRTPVVRTRGEGVGGQAEHEHRHGGQRALWAPDRLASGRPFNRWNHGEQLTSKSSATWAIVYTLSTTYYDYSSYGSGSRSSPALGI